MRVALTASSRVVDGPRVHVHGFRRLVVVLPFGSDAIDLCHDLARLRSALCVERLLASNRTVALAHVEVIELDGFLQDFDDARVTRQKVGARELAERVRSADRHRLTSARW